MLDALRQGALDILNVVAPPICSVCGEKVDRADHGAICRECRLTLEPCGRAVCPTCGHPLVQARKRRCPDCPSAPVYFESARAALLYRGALSEAFYAFKYHGHDEIGIPLAHVMADEFGDFAHSDTPRDVLIPVPLHFLRRWWRGYNQSEILAREFGRITDIPVVTGAVARVRHTPRQALQPRDRRRENVRGAFEVSQPDLLRGAHIGLVDDLLTSGHTVNECARVLMEAGAASVRVLTLARA